MTISQGSCSDCREALVYLAERNGRIVIVVACQDCVKEVVFDLQNMLDALQLTPTESLLENFVPSGRPC